jgi:lipoate-protein ligase B
MRKFESFYLGETDYTAGLVWQRQESDRVRATNVARVLGLEHNAVITLGKRGATSKDLKVTADELNDLGIEIRVIDRGGEATLHSPGQLVVYPLIPLREWNLGVRDYVESLREVTRKTLSNLGVYTFSKNDDEPGLYTTKGKIAFFGIRVDRGVSCHGLALNVQNDLSLFNNIVSCGVNDEKFDSLINQDINATPFEIFEMWMKEFRNHFTLTDSVSGTILTDQSTMRF